MILISPRMHLTVEDSGASAWIRLMALMLCNEGNVGVKGVPPFWFPLCQAIPISELHFE